jgi:dTDP-4-dehydrorhamnose reductase
MKVFVLGHKGMLGHVVASFFRGAGIEVLTTDSRYATEPKNALIRAVIESDAEWVINAIGKIKQKTSQPSELLEANALLPAQLKVFLHSGQKLLHASTDCVFSGKTGNYGRDQQRDAEDVYGLSKVLGEAVAEPDRCQVIRTSIIGPELSTASGLMAWFLSQKHSVKGFTDHLWNGITTFEWSKIALEIVRGNLKVAAPIVQAAAAAPISKYELLKQISDIWNHPITIIPIASGMPINRTLVPDLPRSDIRQQLQEFRAWYQPAPR